MDRLHRAKAGPDGGWRVLLDARPFGGPHEMTISASGRKTVLRDIYFGDVWICSGQSNMELTMQRLRDDFPDEWEAPVNPLIRQFKVPQECDFSGPRRDLSGGRWTVASPDTLHEFSGTAWFFADRVFENHGVPIGLVNAAWGGTPVEAWMSREALAAFPEKIALGDRYDDPALRGQIAEQSESAVKAWHDELTIWDRGLVEKWYKPNATISQWGKITLPGNFSRASLDRFYGSIWLRRQVDISAEFARGGSRLWLGTITDADTVYVNGTEVGSTTYRYPPRKYVVPAGLLNEGENWIVVRVVCCNGMGGVTEGKDFRLFSDQGSVELDGTWEYRVGMRSYKPCPEPFFFQRQPMGLFNAMIAPMLDFPCKGILWYQGESNESNPGEYRDLFAAHVADWQGRWSRADDDIPFLFVQLPIWGEPGENDESSPWAILRDAQRAALSLPATGMAAGLDLGEWNDLHPINKRDVGRRLAFAAERLVFRNRNSSPGPLFRGMKHGQGRLLLVFSNCGMGLVADGEPHVTVIAGGKHHRLPAEIRGPDCLSVDVSSVEDPERILYAWAGNPRDRQLYNSDGLPAIPFRADITDPS
jgi:sialate O-acetylesterase